MMTPKIKNSSRNTSAPRTMICTGEDFAGSRIGGTVTFCGGPDAPGGNVSSPDAMERAFPS
jgi:hypothetical protein